MILPIYLRNVWYSGHLPFNLNRPYDRYGRRYNLSQIVDERANLVQAKYEAYSVLLISPHESYGSLFTLLQVIPSFLSPILRHILLPSFTHCYSIIEICSMQSQILYIRRGGRSSSPISIIG